MKGDLKDTYAWFFISKIISTTSHEIHEIYNLEETLAGMTNKHIVFGKNITKLDPTTHIETN
jgi:hypothetical protein